MLCKVSNYDFCLLSILVLAKCPKVSIMELRASSPILVGDISVVIY